MSTEENTSASNPESTVAGYCRVCGKALEPTDVRSASGVMYCSEHLPAGTPPPPPPSSAAPLPGSPYAAPKPGSDVSPGLAFVLGLIPGVGAIYNAQYAKGLVHVIIFGLLVAIVDNGPGDFEAMFGMLVAAWVAYMAFEAYHTAKKRQLGQPVDEFSSIFPLKPGAGSMAAPLVLIGAGVLFLLINFNLIRLYEVVRFWPALLILLGGYMLYQRVARDRGGDEVSHE